MVTGLLSLARLLAAATLPLGDDEGYYWVWSRHLAASYYDHPPLAAWLVAVSTRCLGVSLLSLRLPFVLLGTGAIFALRALVCDVTGDAELADRSALLFQVIPVFFALGLLVIPDGPLILFWLLAARALWRAVHEDSIRRWLAAGALVGGALLSKYMAVLLPISMGGWMVSTSRRRRLLALLGIVSVAVLVFTPVLWWNASHDWASFRFQFVSRHGGAGFRTDRLAMYVASQALFVSPLLFVLTVLAAMRIGPWRTDRRDAAASFLWWMAVPTLGLFALAGSTDEFKPNWAAPGYLTLIPLVVRGLDRWREGGSRIARSIAWAAVALAVTAVALVATQLLHPFLPFPPGTDPTMDTRGWPAASALAMRAADDLRSRRPAMAGGPLFAAGRYQNASRLEFYLPTHPEVVCLNPGRDAYDDWQDLDTLRGRDIVFVATTRFPMAPNQLVRLRACRVFGQVSAPSGSRTVHVITVYQCEGLGEPATGRVAPPKPTR